ncbi:MAG: biotin/lipoyl-containing protein, partial [Stellaceae bacterium]
FIVDRNKRFYFLEMKTRLKVQHPVTEMVTGLDLVEWMIRIAAGERLPFRQKDLGHSGWAIEARVYAEDPERGFLPSIGRLVRYVPPTGDGVRVDTGVTEGAEITLYYDPMIAKLAAHGPSRATAIERLCGALDGFYVGGLRHNIAFLAAIAASPRFASGALSTDFIAEEFPGGFAPPAEFVAADRVLLVAAALADAATQRPAGDRVVLLDGTPHPVSLRADGIGYIIDGAGEAHHAASAGRPGQNQLNHDLHGRPPTVQNEILPARAFRLAHRGVVRRAQVLPPRTAELLLTMPKKQPADTSRLVLSPMPGLLAALIVGVGQEVKAGEPLAIVEAMKMENVLRAERDGRIAKLCAQTGDSLSVDQVILEFE